MTLLSVLVLTPQKWNDSSFVLFSLFYWLRWEDGWGISTVSCKAFLFSNCLRRCLCSLLGFPLIISEELTGTDHTVASGQNQKMRQLHQTAAHWKNLRIAWERTEERRNTLQGSLLYFCVFFNIHILQCWMFKLSVAKVSISGKRM